MLLQACPPNLGKIILRRMQVWLPPSVAINHRLRAMAAVGRAARRVSRLPYGCRQSGQFSPSKNPQKSVIKVYP